MLNVLGRYVGRVHLRQRWLVNDRGDMMNSRRIPRGDKLIGGQDDTKAPAPSGNLLLVVDILVVACLGKYMQEGWLMVIREFGSTEAQQLQWTDLARIFFSFFISFIRPLSGMIFMWMFVNMMLGWFYLDANPMPLEYGGGNGAYKGAELLLLPTMLCMLMFAYNAPVCMLMYQRTISSHAPDLKQVWKAPSHYCGYLNISNTIIEADPSWLPAEPCNKLTWGSCLFCTVAHIAFQFFALYVLKYVLQHLSPNDYKVSKRVLHVFARTQVLGLCIRIATAYVQVAAIYDTDIPTAETASTAYWTCAFMYNIAGLVDYAPFCWMGFLDVAGIKEYCLPLDSDFLKGRWATLFRVALSNMLLVGVQAEFHNGDALGPDKVYHHDVQRNLLGIFLPMTVWGTKMLYFDSVHATPRELTSANSLNMHAVDSGYLRAIIWSILQITAVGCSGMVSQCLVSILKKGDYATLNEVRLHSIAFAVFTFCLAGLTLTHHYQGALRFRQRRRVVVRCLFATTILIPTIVGTFEHIALLSTWISVFGICGCALTERVLDGECPNDEAFQNDSLLLKDANQGGGTMWRVITRKSTQVLDQDKKKVDGEEDQEEEQEVCAVTAVADDMLLIGFTEMGDVADEVGDAGDVDCHDCGGGHF